MKSADVRVWDMSAGGCLLESRERLPIGTVGLLSMEFDGRRRREWFRICRVHAEEGRRGMCLLGAEFLPLAPAGVDSLRRAASERCAPRRPGGMTAMTGRSSGDPGNSTQATSHSASASTMELANLGGTARARIVRHPEGVLAARLLRRAPRARLGA